MKFFFLALIMSSTAFAVTDNIDSDQLKDILQNSPEVIAKAQAELAKEYEEKSTKDTHDKLEKSPDMLDKVDVPTLGDGDKKINAFVSPYCKHCQELLKDFLELVKGTPAYKIALFFVAHSQDLGSTIAAKALIAATKMGKLKEFFDAMLKRVNMLEEKDVLDLAKSIGLNETEFKNVMDSPEVAQQIKDVQNLQETLNIRGFPTIIYEKSDKSDGKKHAIIPGKPADLPTLKKELSQ